jgi:quercetin dioxygenase-like cupin family protein
MLVNRCKKGANTERGDVIMERVFSVDDMPWADLKGLPGARGFEFKALTNDAYTKAYSCELVRLDPGDHSVPHIEPWSHLLYILSGTGNITIDGSTSPIKSGTVCQVRAGEKHSLRNLGDDNLLILAIYDPPRERKKD